MKPTIVLFLLILTFASTYAQPEDSISIRSKIKYDTNYIISYRDWFHITAVGVNKQTGIMLANVSEENDLQFRTNNPFAFGLAFDYEWLTFEYSRTIKGLEFTDNRKGNSESSSLRLGLTGRKFRMSTFYRRTKGFHLENIEELDPNWFNNNSTHPIYQDLGSLNVAFSIYYTFNHRKYSNTAALWQLDRQIKSAGSPVIGFQTNYELLESEFPLSINDSSLTGETFPDIKRANYFKIGVTGGYMHTFNIIKRFYFHAAFMQGFLYSRGNASYHNFPDSKNIHTLAVSFYFRITAGYNGKKWYGGVFYVSDSFINDALSEIYEITNYDYTRLYIGYRFPIKKRPWMRKFYL